MSMIGTFILRVFFQHTEWKTNLPWRGNEWAYIRHQNISYQWLVRFFYVLFQHTEWRTNLPSWKYARAKCKTSACIISMIGTFLLRFLSAYRVKNKHSVIRGCKSICKTLTCIILMNWTFLLHFLSAYRVKNKPSVKRGCKSVCKTSTFDGGNVYERICWMKCE